MYKMARKLTDFTISMFLILAYGCVTKAGNSYYIRGFLEGVTDGKIVLSILEPNAIFINTDTVIVKNGRFTFEGILKEPKQAMFSLLNSDSSLSVLTGSFWLENNNIKVSIIQNENQKNILHISGSNTNDDFIKYGDFWRLSADYYQLQSKIDNSIEKYGDTSSINQKKEASQKKLLKFEKIKTIVRDNSSSFYCLYGINECRDFFSLTELDEILASFSFDIRKYPTGRHLLDFRTNLSNIQIGKILPEYKVGLENGNDSYLLTSSDKVTVIEFWASWCVPCINQISNLKKTYSKYHKEGLQIIGLSLDDQKGIWLNTVQKYHIPWISVIADDVNHNPKDFFCLTYIPQNIIVDGSGRIIAKNIWGDELDTLIKFMLSKN